MNKINLGLLGYGNVGRGVVQFLQKKRSFFKEKFKVDFVLRSICDRRVHKKIPEGMGKTVLTTNPKDLLKDRELDVIIELIGGLSPAREIVLGALKKGKHVITANKELVANHGTSLFDEARRHKSNLYFESSVMAGVPVIRTLTEGLAGQEVNGLYGIINGTCNYILSEMSQKNLSFANALAEAQKRGFAEADPTLDINGMDSAHKLAILAYLAFGKLVKLRTIHTEGIAQISHDDIEYAESLHLTIKLLAIAKKSENKIEVRVHPTLIAKDHPLAAINGIFNALFLDTQPLGDILLSGEGAGPMAAASGVISDLVNLASRQGADTTTLLANTGKDDPKVKIKKIDQFYTKFYIRIMALDKPGVLSKISGILGKHGISINSVNQRAHGRMTAVPLILITEYAHEKMVRLALAKIHRLPVVKSKPVAIRMENLP